MKEDKKKVCVSVWESAGHWDAKCKGKKEAKQTIQKQNRVRQVKPYSFSHIRYKECCSSFRFFTLFLPFTFTLSPHALPRSGYVQCCLLSICFSKQVWACWSPLRWKLLWGFVGLSICHSSKWGVYLIFFLPSLVFWVFICLVCYMKFVFFCAKW